MTQCRNMPTRIIFIIILIALILFLKYLLIILTLLLMILIFMMMIIPQLFYQYHNQNHQQCNNFPLLIIYNNRSNFSFNHKIKINNNTLLMKSTQISILFSTSSLKKISARNFLLRKLHHPNKSLQKLKNSLNFIVHIYLSQIYPIK